MMPADYRGRAALEEEGLTLLSVSDTAVDVQISGRRSEIKNVKKSDIKIDGEILIKANDLQWFISIFYTFIQILSTS